MNKKERAAFRKMRKGLKISRAALAKQLGVNHSKIAEWETGSRDLSREEEQRIEEALAAILMKRGIPGVVTPEQAQQDLREGAYLARRRDQYGITQSQLAERTNISQGVISAFEQGHADPKPDKIGQLFRAIDAIVEERRTSIPSGFANLADLGSAQAYETWESQMRPSNLQFQLQVAHTAGKALFELNKGLRERVGILQKLVDCQHELLSLCQELVNELGAKDAKIGELENKITQLRQLYEVGTAAVVASERYEQLHQQLSAVPASTDDDK